MICTRLANFFRLLFLLIEHDDIMYLQEFGPDPLDNMLDVADQIWVAGGFERAAVFLCGLEELYFNR